MAYDRPVAFWRENPDGSREVAQRTWLLIWILPVLMTLAGLAMLATQGYRHLASVPTEAEVIRVYEWEGSHPFRGTVPVYGPVFRYTWSDGQPTDATAGISHPSWNLEVGSVHEIRYFAGRKQNVVYGGTVNFYAGFIVTALGLFTALPAGWATWRLGRWLSAGA